MAAMTELPVRMSVIFFSIVLFISKFRMIILIQELNISTNVCSKNEQREAWGGFKTILGIMESNN